MKIIGTTKEGFILEASKDEIANLKGFYSSYQSKTETHVGDTIIVDEIYRRYTSIERLITSDDFSDNLAKLKKAVKLLSPVEEILKESKELVK